MIISEGILLFGLSLVTINSTFMPVIATWLVVGFESTRLIKPWLKNRVQLVSKVISKILKQYNKNTSLFSCATVYRYAATKWLQTQFCYSLQLVKATPPSLSFLLEDCLNLVTSKAFPHGVGRSQWGRSNLAVMRKGNFSNSRNPPLILSIEASGPTNFLCYTIQLTSPSYNLWDVVYPRSKARMVTPSEPVKW